ncbi:hypothetical protein DIPPA_31926 [Diplonema papillatum]|nr:hypothetical protein DIPPA_31926 [Diplonema papillatum]|eukprot:gene14495-22191_t
MPPASDDDVDDTRLQQPCSAIDIQNQELSLDELLGDGKSDRMSGRQVIEEIEEDTGDDDASEGEREAIEMSEEHSQDKDLDPEEYAREKMRMRQVPRGERVREEELDAEEDCYNDEINAVEVASARTESVRNSTSYYPAFPAQSPVDLWRKLRTFWTAFVVQRNRLRLKTQRSNSSSPPQLNPGPQHAFRQLTPSPATHQSSGLPTDVVQKLQSLAQLLTNGLLTRDEYSAAKQVVLTQQPSPGSAEPTRMSPGGDLDLVASPNQGGRRPRIPNQPFSIPAHIPPEMADALRSQVERKQSDQRIAEMGVKGMSAFDGGDDDDDGQFCGEATVKCGPPDYQPAQQYRARQPPPTRSVQCPSFATITQLNRNPSSSRVAAATPPPRQHVQTSFNRTPPSLAQYHPHLVDPDSTPHFKKQSVPYSKRVSAMTTLTSLPSFGTDGNLPEAFENILGGLNPWDRESVKLALKQSGSLRVDAHNDHGSSIGGDDWDRDHVSGPAGFMRPGGLKGRKPSDKAKPQSVSASDGIDVLDKLRQSKLLTEEQFLAAVAASMKYGGGERDGPPAFSQGPPAPGPKLSDDQKMKLISLLSAQSKTRGYAATEPPGGGYTGESQARGLPQPGEPGGPAAPLPLSPPVLQKPTLGAVDLPYVSLPAVIPQSFTSSAFAQEQRLASAAFGAGEYRSLPSPSRHTSQSALNPLNLDSFNIPAPVKKAILDAQLHSDDANDDVSLADTTVPPTPINGVTPQKSRFKQPHEPFFLHQASPSAQPPLQQQLQLSPKRRIRTPPPPPEAGPPAHLLAVPAPRNPDEICLKKALREALASRDAFAAVDFAQNLHRVNPTALLAVLSDACPSLPLTYLASEWRSVIVALAGAVPMQMPMSMSMQMPMPMQVPMVSKDRDISPFRARGPSMADIPSVKPSSRVSGTPLPSAAALLSM